MKHLASVVPLDLEILQTRFENKLRPYLGNPQRESLTLELWIDAINEERTSLADNGFVFASLTISIGKNQLSLFRRN